MILVRIGKSPHIPCSKRPTSFCDRPLPPTFPSWYISWQRRQHLTWCVRRSDNRVWKIWFGNARDGTPLPNQEAVVILHKQVAIWTSLWMPGAETSTDLLNRLLSSSTTAAEWSTTSTNGHSIIPPRAWIICSVSPRIEHFASHLTPDTPDFRQHLSV